MNQLKQGAVIESNLYIKNRCKPLFVPTCPYPREFESIVGKQNATVLSFKRGDFVRLILIYRRIKCKAVNFLQGGARASKAKADQVLFGKEARIKCYVGREAIQKKV